jgi:uncharacterized protein DUF4340
VVAAAMTRKYLKTLLALVALGLLWGGVTFYNKRAAKKPAAVETKPEEKVFSIEPKDVLAFTLAPREGEPFSLSKDNGVWEITAPHKLAASATDVEGWLNSLTGATVTEVADLHPANLKDYGLDSPSEAIEVTTDQNPSPIKLSLGDETPTSSGLYAQVSGNPRVIVIPDYLKTALEKKLFDLRDKRAVTLNADDINRIEVTSKGKTLTLSKGPGDLWNIVVPPAVRADQTAVDTMVDQLRGLSMQTIVAENKAGDSKYGFAKPAITLRLSAGGSTQTLTLGKEESGRYDALNSALDPVFTLDTSIVSAFDKDPASLRDKGLFSFSSFEAHRVEAETPKGKFVFEKQDNKWKMLSPNAKEEASDKMEDLLDSLSELRAQSFPTKDPTNLVAYGLGKPLYTFTVTFGAKNLSETVEAATAGEHLYARRSTDIVPSELSLNALDGVMKALSKL